MTYRTIDEVFSKVDWEGGLYEAAFGYGLSSASIDKNSLPELHEAWVAMEDAYRVFEPAFERVQKMLDEVDGGW